MIPSLSPDETTLYFTSTTVTIAIFLFYYFVIKPWYDRDRSVRYTPSADILSRSEAEGDNDLAIVRKMEIDRNADQEATEMVRQVLGKEEQLVEEMQTAKSITPVPTTGDETIKATELKVYYGTNRTKTVRSDPNKHFGSERLETSKDMNLGYVVVSIPTSHTIGKIERPSFLSFELNEVAEKHVMLIRIEERNRTDFIKELNSDLGTKNDTAFVFVHGYSNTFADAARRTAQIAEDIHKDMMPIMFSWPSKGSVKQYFNDDQAARAAASRLEAFLEMLAMETNVKHIHLIAHSMGNEVLTAALAHMARAGSPATRSFKLEETILAAPDVDKDVFEYAVSHIKSIVRRITIYVSSQDLALTASHAFRKSSYRAGDTLPQPLVIPNVETVDVSNMNFDLLGHTYVGNNRHVLNDIHLIFKGEAPDKRFGIRAKGKYWIFNP